LQPISTLITLEVGYLSFIVSPIHPSTHPSTYPPIHPGLSQFDDVAIHASEAEALKTGNNQETITFLTDEEIAIKPHEKWVAKEYAVQATAVTRELSDGDMLDLGDRQIRVLHLPGHSPGSIALLDVGSDRSLFTGDIVYDCNDPLIDWLPHSDVTAYLASARQLEALAKSGSVTQVYPGHGQSFGPDRLSLLAVNYQHTAHGRGKEIEEEDSFKRKLLEHLKKE
jgi:glyoxylase-like metal-dependent hydrolase (beta-lactamase superfamily II)